MYEDMEKYFKYLDQLRKSGATNMFGAAPYLEKEFGLSYKASVFILMRWMESKK